MAIEAAIIAELFRGDIPRACTPPGGGGGRPEGGSGRCSIRRMLAFKQLLEFFLLSTPAEPRTWNRTNLMST